MYQKIIAGTLLVVAAVCLVLASGGMVQVKGFISTIAAVPSSLLMGAAQACDPNTPEITLTSPAKSTTFLAGDKIDFSWTSKISKVDPYKNELIDLAFFDASFSNKFGAGKCSFWSSDLGTYLKNRGTISLEKAISLNSYLSGTKMTDSSNFVGPSSLVGKKVMELYKMPGKVDTTSVLGHISKTLNVGVTLLHYDVKNNIVSDSFSQNKIIVEDTLAVNKPVLVSGTNSANDTFHDGDKVSIDWKTAGLFGVGEFGPISIYAGDISEKNVKKFISIPADNKKTSTTWTIKASDVFGLDGGSTIEFTDNNKQMRRQMVITGLIPYNKESGNPTLKAVSSSFYVEAVAPVASITAAPNVLRSAGNTVLTVAMNSSMKECSLMWKKDGLISHAKTSAKTSNYTEKLDKTTTYSIECTGIDNKTYKPVGATVTVGAIDSGGGTTPTPSTGGNTGPLGFKCIGNVPTGFASCNKPPKTDGVMYSLAGKVGTTILSGQQACTVDNNPCEYYAISANSRVPSCATIPTGAVSCPGDNIDLPNYMSSTVVSQCKENNIKCEWVCDSRNGYTYNSTKKSCVKTSSTPTSGSGFVSGFVPASSIFCNTQTHGCGAGLTKGQYPGNSTLSSYYDTWSCYSSQMPSIVYECVAPKI